MSADGDQTDLTGEKNTHDQKQMGKKTEQKTNMDITTDRNYTCHNRPGYG